MTRNRVFNEAQMTDVVLTTQRQINVLVVQAERRGYAAGLAQGEAVAYQARVERAFASGIVVAATFFVFLELCH